MAEAAGVLDDDRVCRAPFHGDVGRLDKIDVGREDVFTAKDAFDDPFQEGQIGGGQGVGA